MADIFSEVDEEVRKDKSVELWNKYGKYLIGGVVAIVAVTVGVVSWQKYQINQAEEQGRQFEAAVKLTLENKNEDAAAAFGLLAKEATPGYKALATLRQAQNLIAAGKGSDAVAIYDALAASDADAEFKSAAKIFAAYYLIDNGTAQQVRERVSALVGGGDIWAASAKELLALSELKEGNTDKAVTLFKELEADAGAPRGVKARAAQLLEVLGASEK